MSEKEENLAKRLDWFQAEFGKPLLILSRTCCQCFTDKDERKAVPIKFDLLPEIDYLMLPLCVDCLSGDYDKIKGQLLQYLEMHDDVSGEETTADNTAVRG